MDRWPWHPSSERAWPPSGTTLKTGIAQLISRAKASGVDVDWHAAPGVRVSSSAFTRRAHLEQVTADLTGAEITIDPVALGEDDGDWIPDPERDEVVSRTAGSIGELRLRADPATVNGYEVRADLAVSHAPVDWVVVSRGGELLGTIVEGRDAEKRIDGSFRLSMAQDDVAELAKALVQQVFRGRSRWAAALKELKLAIRPQSENRFVVTAGGAGRVFFVPLSARVGFDLEISRDGSVTVHRATAASRSFLSKLLLLPLRPQLRELAGTTTRLGDDEFAVSDLAVDASWGRIAVSGRLRSR